MNKKVIRKIFWTTDNIINFILLMMLLFLVLISIYSIWDEKKIYSEADPANYKAYKPSEEEGLTFAQLQEKNPDVFAWLSIYGTNIDYPLLQADDNQKYVHTNAIGEYSLVGSLFLDYRNQKDFSDFNSIIYGHHMEADVMFSEIDKFREKDFFSDHKYGNLYFDGKDHGIKIFAFLETDAYDRSIYTPAIEDRGEKEQYLQSISDRADRLRDVGCTPNDQIILFSTCAPDYGTNLRFVLVGKITDETFENPFADERGKTLARSKLGLLDILPLWLITAIMLLTVLLLLLLLEKRRRAKKE